jgi:aldehyde:ferredoxin oxidoreductase
VKAILETIGKDSEKFAVYVKGLELAAWNVHVSALKDISHVTSNRGHCHHNGDNVEMQKNFDNFAFLNKNIKYYH